LPIFGYHWHVNICFSLSGNGKKSSKYRHLSDDLNFRALIPLPEKFGKVKNSGTGIFLPEERKDFMEIITKDGYPCCLINGNKNHVKTKPIPYMKNVGKFSLVKVLGRKPWRKFHVDFSQVS